MDFQKTLLNVLKSITSRHQFLLTKVTAEEVVTLRRSFGQNKPVEHLSVNGISICVSYVRFAQLPIEEPPHEEVTTVGGTTPSLLQ